MSNKRIGIEMVMKLQQSMIHTQYDADENLYRCRGNGQ